MSVVEALQLLARKARTAGKAFRHLATIDLDIISGTCAQAHTRKNPEENIGKYMKIEGNIGKYTKIHKKHMNIYKNA